MTSLSKQILDQQSIKGMPFGFKDNIRLIKAFKYIQAHIPKRSKILDVGCADGYFARELFRAGYECYGLEIYKPAVNKALRTGIKVVHGSFLDKFPFASNFFDVVFAGEVLEHSIDDRRFLHQLYRVLRPNGLLIITVPNLLSLQSRFFILFGHMPPNAYKESHYKYYNYQLLVNKIREARFTIQKVDSSYLLISIYFNKYLGKLGEWLGTIFPRWGENLIVFAVKHKD